MKLPKLPFYSQTPEAQATFKKAVEDAFIAIASRSAGSAYRIADAYNPQLQDNSVTPRPELVVKRELITLALAFGFGLLSSPAMNVLSTLLKIRSEAARKFLVVVTASAIAEGVSRAFVYRTLEPKSKPSRKPAAPLEPPPPAPSSLLAASLTPLRPMPVSMNALNLVSAPPALSGPASGPSIAHGVGTSLPASNYLPPRHPYRPMGRPLSIQPAGFAMASP